MGYPYEDLYPMDFERLVVECCRQIFGIGVQAFSPGKDGGRDAWFHGVAERFPSTASPWRGTTIIQAKLTMGMKDHFIDSDFSGAAKSSVLSIEIPRIQEMVRTNGVTNYLLVSNRRLGGVTAPKIIERISKDTGIPSESIYLAGIEDLDSWLHRYPTVIDLSRVDPFDGPLRVSSFELSDVIIAISDALGSPQIKMNAPVVDRVSFSEKNELNKMSPEFANELLERYLWQTNEIEKFLASPGNVEHLKRYEAAVEDFQLKIIAKRSEFDSFDDLFIYLTQVLVKQDGVLKARRSLLYAMIFYMYWHCDIGKTPNADPK